MVGLNCSVQTGFTEMRKMEGGCLNDDIFVALGGV